VDAQGDEESEKKEAENGKIADKETPQVDATDPAVETAPADKAEEGVEEVGVVTDDQMHWALQCIHTSNLTLIHIFVKH